MTLEEAGGSALGLGFGFWGINAIFFLVSWCVIRWGGEMP